MAIFLQGVLAFTEGVPQLDGLVTGRRHNLTVVWGETHGEDVLGVTNELAGSLSGRDVPQTEGLVWG